MAEQNLRFGFLAKILWNGDKDEKILYETKDVASSIIGGDDMCQRM